MIWNDKCEVIKTIKAHASPITAIIFTQGKLISGSKDSKISIIVKSGDTFKLEKIIDLGTAVNRGPNSIDFFNNNLLVGLKNGSIIELKNVLEEGNEQRTLM